MIGFDLRKNLRDSGCRLSLEKKTCVPEIFIRPSKISAQFSVYFQNFTEKIGLLLTSSLKCCSIFAEVLMSTI